MPGVETTLTDVAKPLYRTYVGSRSRTTGAPANHWFGPCGDPRSAGIHTIEAIQSTWSGHREVIVDSGIPVDWTRPDAT